MTASLGIGVDASGALASAGAGAGLTFPHGANSSTPASEAGEGGFRSRWQWLLGANAVGDETPQSSDRFAGAKPDGALPGSRIVNALPQSSVQTAARAPFAEKHGAEIVLIQRVNGPEELSPRSLSKAAIPSVFGDRSDRLRQRKEGKDDSLRKAGGDFGHQPNASLPISAFAPVPAQLPAGASRGSITGWRFPRTQRADNQILTAVAGGSQKTDRATGEPVGEPVGEQVGKQGEGATAVQPNIAAEQEAGKNDPRKMNSPNGGDLSGQGSAAEPKASAPGKDPRPATVRASLTVEQQGQSGAATAAPQSDWARQAAISTDAALNRRPEQSAFHGVRNRNPGETAVQTLHSGAMTPVAGPDTVTVPHHPAAGLAVEHGLHPIPSGSDGAAIATRETFAALDGEPRAAAATWIHAGAQRAEAGFQDPALGWVAVRADVGAGGVHASILPGSADAAQTLGGHLAGLHAHLADAQIPVLSLSIRASAESGGSGLGQGALQQDSRHPGRGGEDGPALQNSIHGSQRVLQEEHFAVGPARGAPVGTAGQGTYISVMV